MVQSLSMKQLRVLMVVHIFGLHPTCPYFRMIQKILWHDCGGRGGVGRIVLTPLEGRGWLSGLPDFPAEVLCKFLGGSVLLGL